MSFLDELPVATLSFIVSAVLAVIGYLNHDLTVLQAFAAVGVVGIGGGQIGQARNGAGRGVKR